MLARSTAKLNQAYCNKPIQPVCLSAQVLKPCPSTPIVPCTPRRRRSAPRRRKTPCIPTVPCIPIMRAPPRRRSPCVPVPTVPTTPIMRAPARRRTPSAAATRDAIWDSFHIVGASGKNCKDGKQQFFAQCIYCKTQKTYCSRNGPGNLKTHLLTNKCIAHQQGRPPVPAVPRGTPSACAGQTQANCKTPCSWKSGAKRKFCSKSRAAPAPPAEDEAAMLQRAMIMSLAPPAAAPIRRRRAPAVAPARRTRVPSECNVIKSRSDCKEPCIWRKGKGKSEFCSKKPVRRNLGLGPAPAMAGPGPDDRAAADALLEMLAGRA